jgi:hypothetical protein
MNSYDHADAINTVLKMGFKGRAARNEYLYLLNKLSEIKQQQRIEEISQIQFLRSHKECIKK